MIKYKGTNTKSIGDAAEKVAAKHLTRHAYKILAKNWKTSTSEIDIIAIKDEIIFFYEIRYRKNLIYGGGLYSIDKKKLERMYQAAEHWVNENDYDGDWELGFIEVTGEKLEITEHIEGFNI
jgi:uncharacterized protein (TIGR00252 family)